MWYNFKIMDAVVSAIFTLIVLLLSIIIHEIAHGSVALYLGDPTAKNAGRLTLNPIKHLDPVGSFFLPLVLFLSGLPMFGWAKPVPVNPYNFRDQKYGSLKVALAGPGVNLAVALVFGLILRFSLAFIPGSLASTFSSIVYLNILLAVFNLLPIPPLDGSHILFTFLPYSMQKTKIFLTKFGFFILIFCIFFFPWFFRFLTYIINWIFTIIVGASLF